MPRRFFLRCFLVLIGLSLSAINLEAQVKSGELKALSTIELGLSNGLWWHGKSDNPVLMLGFNGTYRPFKHIGVKFNLLRGGYRGAKSSYSTLAGTENYFLGRIGLVASGVTFLDVNGTKINWPVRWDIEVGQSNFNINTREGAKLLGQVKIIEEQFFNHLVLNAQVMINPRFSIGPELVFNGFKIAFGNVQPRIWFYSGVSLSWHFGKRR